MKRIICSIFALSLLSVSSLYSQNNDDKVNVWALEQCVDYAIRHNIQVRQAQNRVSGSELNKEQAEFNFYPTLGASSSYSVNLGRALDPTTYQFIYNQTVQNVDAGVALSAPLFAGFEKHYTLRQSKIDLKAAIKDVQAIQDNISLNVASSYLQILYYKEQIKINDFQVKNLEQQVERTSIMFQAGSVAKSTLLELEAQLASERYNLVNSQNELENNLLTLRLLLELPSTTKGFDIVSPGELKVENYPLTQTPLSDIFDTAKGVMPIIEAAELRLESAKVGEDIARSKLYPTLGLRAQYGSSFSDARQKSIIDPGTGTVSYEKYLFWDQMSDNSTSAIGLSLSIPIFNGFTARRQVKLAKVTTNSSVLELDQKKNDLYNNIQKAWFEASAAINRYYAANKSVESSEEAFFYAQQKFDVGSITPFEFNASRNSLLSAQTSLLLAKYEYIFKLKVIDFYLGNPITL